MTEPLTDAQLDDLAGLHNAVSKPMLARLIKDYKFYRDSAAERDQRYEEILEDANRWEARATAAQEEAAGLRATLVKLRDGDDLATEAELQRYKIRVKELARTLERL